MIRLRLDEDAKDQLDKLMGKTIAELLVKGNKKNYRYFGLATDGNYFTTADSHPNLYPPPFFWILLGKQLKKFELHGCSVFYSNDFQDLVEALQEKHMPLGFHK